MKLSIVTPSYNQAGFIGDTIESVLRQDTADVEHIVIDGGSTDGTVDVLHRYPHLIWVSEHDEGQSQAINKGFARASGDIVAWINSDDYYEENIFSTVAGYFEMHPECNVLYGDIVYIDKDKHERYRLTGPAISFETLRGNPDIIRQPSIFWRKSALDEVGGIDEHLHVVMDYDFFIRLAKKFEFHHVPRIFSYFRDYSDNKTHALMKQQAVELLRVSIRHRLVHAKMLKFLLGRYLDGCSEQNIVRKILSFFRKNPAADHEKNPVHRS